MVRKAYCLFELVVRIGLTMIAFGLGASDSPIGFSVPSLFSDALTSFSREPASCAGSLGLNSTDNKKIGGD